MYIVLIQEIQISIQGRISCSEDTRGVVFIPAIGVAGNDLFTDEIGLLIISL